VSELSTSDQILAAAMGLFAEKGFVAVTTKEIAAKAQISEVTLFRYFETKRMLYIKVFEKYVIQSGAEDALNQELIGDLRTDLVHISSSIQNTIKRNIRLIKINIKDNREIFEFADEKIFSKQYPLAIKEKLCAYFADMKKKGKVIGEPDILAMNFVLVNFSLALQLIHSNEKVNDDYIDQCSESLINIFIRGISV